jgi:hypothetical protein
MIEVSWAYAVVIMVFLDLAVLERWAAEPEKSPPAGDGLAR